LRIADKIKKALQSYAEGQRNKHLMNMTIQTQSPVGVAEHPDAMESIMHEAKKVAEYDDILEVLNKYF